MPHPFIVGGRYFDRNGEYVVIAIGERSITCRYDDGTEKTSDIEMKERVYKNIIGERRALHPHQSQAYFRTLGFFAHHADFQAEVPPQAQISFEDKYEALTNIRPKLQHDGYYPVEVLTGNEKWGAELRIYFPAECRAILDFPDGIEVRSAPTDNLKRINSNDLWWRLIKLGFRLNKQHDVQSIENSVPNEFLNSFREGLAL